MLAGTRADWYSIPLSVAGSARRRLAKDGDELALTADGKRLAYAAGNTVRAVHLDANYQLCRCPTRHCKEKPHAISSIHWSADGRALVYQVWNYTKAVTDGVVRLIHPAASIGISQILPGWRRPGD